MSIIEPNEALKRQTADKLGLVDYSISIYTMEEFYQYGCEPGIIILDEFDELMASNPYEVVNHQLHCIWEFKD